MEMIKRLGSSKGQLMTIATLVFVTLMVSALLVLVIVGISYDSISESTVLSSSTSNYAQSLQSSADIFAYKSGSQALHVLFIYEYNSSLRKTNVISNFSLFMQYLIRNGTLPGVPAGSAAAKVIYSNMSNSTLASYNAIVSSLNGAGSKVINVTETKPSVFQVSPYAISIKYIEYVNITTAAGSSTYTIPVNASIPLNNTPDLFYAQQGIFAPITFSSAPNQAQIIGGDYASSGNTSSFIYGTVIFTAPTSCSLTGIVPAALNLAPYNQSLIIVAPNAVALTSGGCTVLNKYGGLITDKLSTPPSIPYLKFSSTNNALAYLNTGQQVLLYGPSLAVLNISNLINNVNSGSYFASPFAASFSDRVSGDLQDQSPAGIFTFGISRRQAAYFNASKSSLITTTEQQTNAVQYTEAAWVYPTSLSGLIDYDRGSGGFGHSLTLGVGSSLGCGGPQGSFFFGDNSNNVGIGVQSYASFPANRWYFVVGTFSGAKGVAVNPSQFQLYVNGAAIANFNWCSGGFAGQTGSDTAPLSGSGSTVIGDAFSGFISNLQIYNTSLSASQVEYLYQEGIEGIPLNDMLLGWYPLNGNPNDYTGGGYTNTGTTGYTVTQNKIAYSIVPGYTRDSVLPGNLSQYSYPIPGVANCNNLGQCSNYSLPHLYMGDNPLSIGSAGLSAAYFNGQTSCIGVPSVAPFDNKGSWTYSGWIYPQIGNYIYTEGVPSNTLYIYVEPNNALSVDTQNAGTWQTALTTPAGAITLNQWNYIAITLSGASQLNPGAANIYVDGGSPVKTGTLGEEYTLASFPSSSHYMALGNNVGSYECPIGLHTSSEAIFPFKGLMADVQLYNTALTQSQINALYQQGITSVPVVPANIVAWYRLDGNTNDYSSYQNSAIPNSTSFQYVDSGYSGSDTLPAFFGSQSVGNVNGEWQTLGFGARSVPQFLWNVTGWNVCPSITPCSRDYLGWTTSPDPAQGQPSTYNAFLGNVLNPAPVNYGGYIGNNVQSAVIASGILGGDQQWAFGTDTYVQILPSVGLYGQGGDFLGLPNQLFPPTLSAMSANLLPNFCSGAFSAPPYNSTGFTAFTTQKLSGTYNIRTAIDDLMEIFYKPVWATYWTPVLQPSADGWGFHFPFPKSTNVSFAPDTYQIAVEWQNICADGLSDFSMVQNPSVVWNVKAYTESAGAGGYPYPPSLVNPLSFSGSPVTGMWFGGPVNGPQEWDYASPTYLKNNMYNLGEYAYNGLAPAEFPQPFNSGSVNLDSESNTCAPTCTYQIYTANTIMYLSGTYSFYLNADSQEAAFYEPIGGATWIAVDPAEKCWDVYQPALGSANPCGPFSVTLPAGTYNVGVVWTNQNGPGLSAFWMS